MILLKINNEEGFTLIETLIALVILGIGLSILVEGYLIVTDSIEYQRDYNYVLNWSETKMAEIVHKYELGRHGNFEYSGKVFQWNVEESYNADQSEIGLKTINLIVKWRGSNGSKTYRTARTVLKMEL